MEASEFQRAWEIAADTLRSQLSDMSYDSWIQPLTPLVWTPDQMTFMLQNDFQINHVRQRYSAMIEKVMKDVTGLDRRAQFVLPAEAEQRRAIRDEQLNRIPLNYKYTFDNFVVGPSNRFAQAAAVAVANNIGTAYNPLFIYGGVGLGKTHLMHAIGNYIIKNRPDSKLLYVTSESFTNELISAIQTKRNHEFREKYRSLDILLIDDIQFIAGTVSTQEEIFHTFNALHQANKQIVLSSDKPPRDMPMLEQRLVSRFESGLVADIQKPDFETTVAILRKKAENANMAIPDDVFVLIAQHVFSSVREMEGCLTRVTAYSALTGCPVSCDLAREVLKDLKSVKDPKRISPELIIETVSNYYGVSVLDMKSQKRSREVVMPRQVAMFLMRDMLNLSLPRIGSEFSGRDHTTVMHSCEKISAQLLTDYRLGSELEDIKTRINET